MAIDDSHDAVIEIDLYSPAPNSRRPRYVLVVGALIVGFVLGVVAAGVTERANPPAPPAVAMHTVVVTEDGRSETYTMPTGSVVSTPPVANSCSITIDGNFADVLNRVVGDAECGAVVR